MDRRRQTDEMEGAIGIVGTQINGKTRGDNDGGEGEWEDDESKIQGGKEEDKAGARGSLGERLES